MITNQLLTSCHVATRCENRKNLKWQSENVLIFNWLAEKELGIRKEVVVGMFQFFVLHFF